MGGKYPHLCFMGDLLLEFEPDSRFIHIDRPHDESIRSLTYRSAKAHGAGLLDEVDLQASTFGRALPVEHYRHALHVTLISDNQQERAWDELMDSLDQYQLKMRRKETRRRGS